MQDNAMSWYSHRPHLVAWLVFLFPVGFYGLWKTGLWDQRTKWWIVGGVLLVVTVIAALGRTGEFLYVLIFCPAALWWLWQDENTARQVRYLFSTILGFYFLVLVSAGGVSGRQSTCSATFVQNGCTYYRDSSCNVIGRQCN